MLEQSEESVVQLRIWAFTFTIGSIEETLCMVDRQEC